MYLIFFLLGNLRECLEKIIVNKTNTINLNQIILCDDLHKTESLDESKVVIILCLFITLSS